MHGRLRVHALPSNARPERGLQVPLQLPLQLIGVTWQTDDRPLGDERVRAIVARALEHGGRAGVDLDVVFVSDEELAALHAEWLDDSTPTDVITFDLGDEGEGPVGEVYVSVDCARRVAPTRPVSVERELALYVVHGVLHLCGHDDVDPEERRRMRAAEAFVLDVLGYPPDPQPAW